jgi:hypothetical protein
VLDSLALGQDALGEFREHLGLEINRCIDGITGGIVAEA